MVTATWLRPTSRRQTCRARSSKCLTTPAWRTLRSQLRRCVVHGLLGHHPCRYVYDHRYAAEANRGQVQPTKAIYDQADAGTCLTTANVKNRPVDETESLGLARISEQESEAARASFRSLAEFLQRALHPIGTTTLDETVCMQQSCRTSTLATPTANVGTGARQALLPGLAICGRNEGDT